MIDLIAARAEALVDAFRRPITYLRVSVTDRCNLRCVYCMPEAGLPWIPKPEILDYEEIAAIIRAAASIGVRSIRLTGGEPLIRCDLERLVALIAAIPGIDDIALSTNGLLLADQAAALRAAGLRRVNVSLDTLHDDRFTAIARRPGLSRVLAGIDAALAEGLGPVKLNCVLMRGVNDDELEAFAEMTRTRAVHVRFIEVMPVHDNVALQRDAWISSDEVLERLGALGALHAVPNPHGNGPARTFAYDGVPGTVGVISPLAHDYCETCNRVRLSADGRLKLCLFGDHLIDLRTPLRAGGGEAAIVALLRAAMHVKPERHHLALGETASAMRAFSEIGG
ncbi:GTP 3',8-cyclase [Vulcanimicrobium alpinum]|uniref:GTP 3',8-cyclase n=1 Tax=Vulcanimicrobium alpinum TaxID=3016050 RepID=A0AAN1XXM7_UNVUL|nr:GTP 3',8-cyclase MoaA [Vulcanimicrobium alpinum]BDE06248.1 GTP 3',8-cyclase [Vulcanimicrobium alpinum]